jgi:hypothetical protein
MRRPVRTCTKCGVRLIPHTHNYIYDETNRKAIRVCKHCHDEHVRRKSKNARTHGNEIRAQIKNILCKLYQIRR